MTLTPARRKAIYRVLVAVGALGVVYGLITPEHVDAWLQVASAVLLIASNELAARNVATDEDEPVEDDVPPCDCDCAACECGCDCDEQCDCAADCDCGCTCNA